MEHKALSQIMPIKAQTLLLFMQGSITEPREVNPVTTWEESHKAYRLIAKVWLVCGYQANAAQREVTR